MDSVAQKKKCGKCGLWKDRSLFYAHKSRRDGLASDCIECQKNYRKENSEHIKEIKRLYRTSPFTKKPSKAQSREYALKRKYKFSSKLFNEINKKQNGVCAICGSDNNGKILHIDHNHHTGKVRGLLCNKCNLALGLIRDDESIAAKMSKYLKEWNSY